MAGDADEAELAAQQAPMADDAEEEERNARDALEAAEAAADDVWFGEARRMLDEPGAKSAATALLAITAVARNYEGDALIAIKKAERNVRDVVALRCRSRTNPADREAWLRTAKKAFGDYWNDRDVKTSLRLAYSKVAQNRPDTSFLSTNQINTARRGRQRPRRGERQQRQNRSAPPATSSLWRVDPARVPLPQWAPGEDPA